MEFKINRTHFLNALGWTQSVVERKTTMPILSNALLEVAHQKVRVMATDLEVGVITQAEAEVIEEGRICTPAKNLYDIIKELPSEEIKICQKETGRLEIGAKKSNFKILSLSPEEFPKLPTSEGKKFYPIQSSGLKEMLDKTLYATSSDESRYNLHGVYLEQVGEKKLRMVATDGHRLSYVEREMSRSIELKKGVIIPKKAVLELKRLVGEAGNEEGGKDLIEMLIDGRNLISQRGNVTLIARLIDGDFPDYGRVIPKSQDKFVKIDRLALMGGLKRVSLMINDRSRGVKFNLSSGFLELSTTNPDLGEAVEEIAADYKGDILKVGFNARYFLDILNVLEDREITLELCNEVGPCMIRSSIDKGFLSVVMPMRI